MSSESIRVNVAKAVSRAAAHQPMDALALGLVRYEAVRLLPPSKFSELFRRSLSGMHFDDLVDELVSERFFQDDKTRNE